MAWLKLCASTTFEILLISTCTLCQQKSYISKGIHPIFEIFPSARRCWGWAFGWKVSGAQVFYFCHDKVKLCASTTFEVLLISNCTLCQQKSYIPKGIQPVFQIFASARRRWGRGIWMESFMGAVILLLLLEGEIFAHRKHLKFCHFQPVHCASRNPISPKIFNQFSKSFASARRCWRWPFGWKVSGAQVFYFCNGKVKILRNRKQLKFCYFQPVHCASQNPISPKVFSRFSKSLPSARRRWGRGIWMESFMVRRYFTSAMTRWNFGHRQHLTFCYFQPVHCASKNPISPKIFNRFSNSLHQLEDVERRHLGGKFQVCTCFIFAMARWKLCASTNIWNFATLNMYTVPAKILYLQRHSTDFRNLCLSSNILRQGIRVESFIWAGILILQWQRENFAHRQHLKFCYFQPVHGARKNPISPKVFNRFSKSLPPARRCWGWEFACKDSGAQILYCCNGIVKTLRIDDIWNFATFQPVHCASQNPISPKIFNRFSNSLHQLEDVERRHLGGKFQVCTCFMFAMARWKLCASTTFEILPLSTCTLCQQKSNISKDIQQIFEIFPSTRRCWGWEFGCKASGAQIFYFCNGMVKTLRIHNIWNFATFNLYTVPAKILYLQRYSTDFRNLCLCSKMLRDRIWLESLRCANILLLQWQGENFAHRQHLKFCHFQPVHCASKNPISPKIFNRFSKSFPPLEDVEGGNLGVKLQVRRYFTFAMAWWKLCASTTFEILPLSTCTLWQQKSYISKGIQPIFEIFASARRC